MTAHKPESADKEHDWSCPPSCECHSRKSAEDKAREIAKSGAFERELNRVLNQQTWPAEAEVKALREKVAELEEMLTSPKIEPCTVHPEVKPGCMACVVRRLGDAEAENEDHRRGMLIPGEQQCVTCGFSLSKLVMRASDGAIGVNAAAPLEECPNGCGFLVAVTWRQGCIKMGEVAEAHLKRAEQAEAERDALGVENARWRERCYEAERDLAIAGVRGSPPPFEATIPRLIRESEAKDLRIKALEHALRMLKLEAHGILALERTGIAVLVSETNVRCLERRIVAAEVLLSAGDKPPCEGGR